MPAAGMAVLTHARAAWCCAEPGCPVALPCEGQNLAGNHAPQGQVYQGPGSMSGNLPDQAGSSNSCILWTLLHVQGGKCMQLCMHSSQQCHTLGQAVVRSSCSVCSERGCCLSGSWLVVVLDFLLRRLCMLATHAESCRPGPAAVKGLGFSA